MKRLLPISLAALALLIACGGVRHAEEPTIEDLRRRAAIRPLDPITLGALAEGELLLTGGDAARAEAAISRALELSPESLQLRYLAATERELHGDLSAALDGYLDVVRRAVNSTDPLAPAMAAVSAAEVESLDDAVVDFAPRVTEALTPVHEVPGGIGDEARATIADLLVDLAYRRGDPARVAAIATAQRCVTSWRLAGPFGPRHLLSYDTELAPDGQPSLGDEYDLGPSRGTRATRDVLSRGCNLHLGGGPVGGAGTTYAEATLTLPASGRWVIRLETPNAVRLFVDGEEVAALDRRREALPRVTYHVLTLAAGEHRVRARVTSRHPNPVLAISASQTAGEPGGAPIAGESLTAAHVRAQSAMTRGDVVGARELLRPHVADREASSAFLVAGAAASLNDPLRGSTVRHDEARRLLGWAVERDDAAWYPVLAIAQLEANEGRSQVAIAALREATERWPGLVVMPLQLVDYVTQRGWHSQAAEAVAQARTAVPSACRPLRAAMNHARRRHRATEELEHARAIVACDARSDAMLTLHIRRRAWDEATAELRRLAALEPDPEETALGALRVELDLATSRGDDEAAARLLARLAARIPLSAGLVLRSADRSLASGDASGAHAQLQAALTAEPEAMMDLRRAVRAIGGPSPLEGYRRDGAEVIRSLEESERVYEEPMVLVFDYTVYRVFEDGSMMELTHNIYRLQSQEAVDAMGEFHVPEEAQMLTLRTVKEDGTRLEPDEIAGKDTISFPSLSPGDYIEFEYMRPRPAPAGYPSGFIGDRFFFRNYETPFDHSELTVVVPRDVELSVETRGPAPETEVSVVDDTRVYRWSVDESRPLTQEPASVASREFIPSVYWGRGATWDLYIESLRDVLSDRDVVDPAARRLVQSVVGDDHQASAEQRATRLRQWVLENIDNSNDVFGLAPAMLAARTGNRTRILHYLFGLAGLESELALVRSYGADATASEMPDDDTYQHLVVRLRGSDDWLWVHAGARGSPFSYLPTSLAGMDAILLNEAGERVTVVERALETDLRTVEVDVELRRDGGARVQVVETQRGAGAVYWRNQLEGIAEENLEAQFESQYVSNLLPGGELTRLVITGRQDPEGPLVLRYEVELPQLARPSSDGWVMPPLFRAHLAAQYARVASRTVTQLILSGLAMDVVVHVRGPEGATFVTIPDDASLDGVHGARARVVSTNASGELELHRSYRIPRMRIEADAYPGFAQFCRASDEAEASEVHIRM